MGGKRLPGAGSFLPSKAEKHTVRIQNNLASGEGGFV